MQLIKFVIASFLTAVATASVKPHYYNYLDTYDDLQGNVGLGLSPIGTYNGLNFIGWSVGAANAATNTYGGVTPQSRPNVLTTTAIIPGVSYMTPASPFTCFYPLAVWFACITRTKEGVVNVPTGCSGAITIGTGDDQSTVPFNYFPDNIQTGSMQHLANLPQYVCVTNVTFGLTSPAVELVIDGFYHQNVAYY